MTERVETIAGLSTTVVPSGGTPTTMVVVLLHGYDMTPNDLAPFAHSIALPATFVLPRGPVTSHNGNCAWWPVDVEARAAAATRGPRDLADQNPMGVDKARAQLGELVDTLRRDLTPRKIIVGGFSQGGMLACDAVLESTIEVDGLVLLSASRIRHNDWERQSTRLRALPIFISHGRRDTDLAFAAGERLYRFVQSAGARTTWVPFDGGHETSLVVWRNLRTFLRSLLI